MAGPRIIGAGSHWGRGGPSIPAPTVRMAYATIAGLPLALQRRSFLTPAIIAISAPHGAKKGPSLACTLSSSPGYLGYAELTLLPASHATVLRARHIWGTRDFHGVRGDSGAAAPSRADGAISGGSSSAPAPPTASMERASDSMPVGFALGKDGGWRTAFATDSRQRNQGLPSSHGCVR